MWRIGVPRRNPRFSVRSNYPRLNSLIPSARSWPTGEICLYKVCRVILSSRIAYWPCFWLSHWCHCQSQFDWRHFYKVGRRSTGSADARPAVVLSAISSRSNSASAAKITEDKLASGRCCVDSRPVTGQHSQTGLLAVRSCTALMRWRRSRPRRSSWHCCKVSDEAAFVLFKGLTFQKTLLTSAFRPWIHNKMLRSAFAVVHASPQYLWWWRKPSSWINPSVALIIRFSLPWSIQSRCSGT